MSTSFKEAYEYCTEPEMANYAPNENGRLVDLDHDNSLVPDGRFKIGYSLDMEVRLTIGRELYELNDRGIREHRGYQCEMRVGRLDFVGGSVRTITTTEHWRHSARTMGVMPELVCEPVQTSNPGEPATYVFLAHKILADIENECLDVAYDESDDMMYRCTPWGEKSLPMPSLPTPESMLGRKAEGNIKLTASADGTMVDIAISFDDGIYISLPNIYLDSWRQTLIRMGIVCSVNPYAATQKEPGAPLVTEWDFWVDTHQGWKHILVSYKRGIRYPCRRGYTNVIENLDPIEA